MMLRLSPVAAALFLTLGACSNPPEFAEAQAAAAAKFPYPSSAEFRGVRFQIISRPEEPYVCGEVRAKGLSGELVGWRRFGWSRAGGAIVEGETRNAELARGVDVLVRCP
jgi:hypothetical protein